MAKKTFFPPPLGGKKVFEVQLKFECAVFRKGSLKRVTDKVMNTSLT